MSHLWVSLSHVWSFLSCTICSDVTGWNSLGLVDIFWPLSPPKAPNIIRGPGEPTVTSVSSDPTNIPMPPSPMHHPRLLFDKHKFTIDRMWVGLETANLFVIPLKLLGSWSNNVFNFGLDYQPRSQLKETSINLRKVLWVACLGNVKKASSSPTSKPVLLPIGPGSINVTEN